MEDKDLIIETTLLAGKIMIENGADMARIDDTLKRIAKNSGVTEPDIFETTTGIMMSIKGANAQVIAIEKRRIDLERIARVNDISRPKALITKVGKKSCHEPLYMISNVAPTTPAANTNHRNLKSGVVWSSVVR